MEWGYKFNRGKGVFDSFVNDLYSEKKNATNSIIRNSRKLELNSLYGKFGQKDSSSIMKIIRKDDVDKFTKN